MILEDQKNIKNWISNQEGEHSSISVAEYLEDLENHSQSFGSGQKEEESKSSSGYSEQQSQQAETSSDMLN